MLADDFCRAALPLLAAGEVEVLEWSFDTGWGAGIPEWAEGLLEAYASADRLLGHGVSMSVLSGENGSRDQRWLERFQVECAGRRYRQVSEHFGFCAAGRFERAAPLPAPLGAEALAVGRRRLAALAEISSRPVGLENLAFAFCHEDVARQGEFLDSLLSPVKGFLLLDLHNLHCQAKNFRIDPDALLDRYPLERVRELHISGGSFSELFEGGGPVRRDTHDGDVPSEVFALLRLALDRCPAVEAVILERLGGTLADEESAARLRSDYRRARSIVATRGGADG